LSLAISGQLLSSLHRSSSETVDEIFWFTKPDQEEQFEFDIDSPDVPCSFFRTYMALFLFHIAGTISLLYT
jgi:hypothetical protein